jgi:hypothetical protein
MTTLKFYEAEKLLNDLDMPDYFEIIENFKNETEGKEAVNPENGNYSDSFLEWITDNFI